MTKEYQKGLAEALALAPVVPVMVIENVEDAVPLARALLAGGIPARLSETAGLYLCNAAMYRLLGRLPAGLACGFVHLPPLPTQVARRIARAGGRVSGRDPGLASMALDLQVRAIEVAIEATLAEAGGAG